MSEEQPKQDEIPAFTPPPIPEGVRSVLDVEYARTPEKTLLMDIFLPEKLPAAPLPVIMNAHGGGWAGGSKEGRGNLRQIAQGFAYASINYRFSQEAPYPAQIHDCKGAVRFLRAHAKEYHLDADRIGVWGGSAGGHLVALLGTSAGVKELEGEVGGNLDFSSEVQAVCDFCGPTDFSLYLKLGGRKTYGWIIEMLDKLLGGPLEEQDALAKLANPLAFITGNEPPFLIVHGKDDNAVPYQCSEALHEALTKAGVDSTLHLVHGVGHFIGGPELEAETDAFFIKHLKAGSRD